MKKILLALLIVTAFSCSKDEDPAPAPPTVTTPPSDDTNSGDNNTDTGNTDTGNTDTGNTDSDDTSSTEDITGYQSGDITINSAADLESYAGQTIEYVDGNFTINVDWEYTAGSDEDPSSLTSSIKSINGNVTIVTNSELSFAALNSVAGDYSVTGHDVIDSKLSYAKTVSLDYPQDYIIESMYTDQIGLNLDDGQTSKGGIKTSKNLLLRAVIIKAIYHTSVLNSVLGVNPLNAIWDAVGAIEAAAEEIATIAPPVDIELTEKPAELPQFVQTDKSGGNGVISSDNLETLEIGGTLDIRQIISESVTDVDINNEYMEELYVSAALLTDIAMPFITTLASLDLLMAPTAVFSMPLLSIVTEIFILGPPVITFPALTTVTGRFEVQGASNINLPVVTQIGTQVWPAGVTFSAPTGIIEVSSGGGGGGSTPAPVTETSETTTSETSSHNSGGDHDSGGGHNSGGSIQDTNNGNQNS